jgi:hypothetical protein
MEGSCSQSLRSSVSRRGILFRLSLLLALPDLASAKSGPESDSGVAYAPQNDERALVREFKRDLANQNEIR